MSSTNEDASNDDGTEQQQDSGKLVFHNIIITCLVVMLGQEFESFTIH
jgi:hypothetical protein